MSYVRLQSEILKSRDSREETLHKVSHFAHESVIFISSAIPGRDKSPVGLDGLFSWVRSVCDQYFEYSHWHLPFARDALGPYAILSVPQSLKRTKQSCIDIEHSQPVARLLDLDVYNQQGQRIGRNDIDMPARSCFICEQPAAECIRTLRHTNDELNNYVKRLLKSIPA